MLIFVIIILLIVVSFILFVRDIAEPIPGLIAFTCIVAFVILTALYLGVIATEDAQHNKYIQRREALVYQLENDMYSNDNEVGKFELYTQIKEFNEDLAYCKAMNNNIFIGCFTYNFYEKIDYIPFEVSREKSNPTV